MGDHAGCQGDFDLAPGAADPSVVRAVWDVPRGVPPCQQVVHELIVADLAEDVAGKHFEGAGRPGEDVGLSVRDTIDDGRSEGQTSGDVMIADARGA